MDLVKRTKRVIVGAMQYYGVVQWFDTHNTHVLYFLLILLGICTIPIFMNYLNTLILGFVEGVTEFLPVSSTFHLLQVSRLLQIPQDDFVKLFEVAIQSGAVFSLVFLFKKEIWFTKRLYLKLLMSTVPALIAGYFLHGMIKNVFFESTTLITIVFIIVGILFLLVEWFVGRHSWRIMKGILDVSWFDALIVGLAQVFSLVPGVSRSGSVIIAMLLRNYRREDAATYSLALSLPTIVAATGYDVYKNRGLFTSGDMDSMFIFLFLGFVVSFVVAYFAARWLVGFLQKRTLRVFGIYRIVVGILLFIVLTR